MDMSKQTPHKCTRCGEPELTQNRCYDHCQICTRCNKNPRGDQGVCNECLEKKKTEGKKAYWNFSDRDKQLTIDAGKRIRRISDDQVRMIRELAKEGLGPRAICKKLDIRVRLETAVQGIIKRRTYKDVE